MKKRIALPLVGLVLAAAAGGGWYWWTELRFRESTDNAYVQGDLSIVSPKIAGYVVSVDTDENRPVRRGDVLVRLDDRDIRARLDQATASLQAKEAAIVSAATQLTVQDTRIREAAATLASAQADTARAESDFARYGQLVERKNASVQALDVARAEAARTRANVDAADAALEAARDQIGVLNAQRSTAEAERDMAKAALVLAQNELSDSVLKAPIDGVVGNRNVQVGDYLKVGQQLMAVVPIGQLYIEANFKETQIEGMRVGGKVQLKLDAFPSQPIEGRIESFAPASGSTFSLLPPENASGNFTKIVQRVPVRIALPPASPLTGLLRPGLSVVVTADLRESGGDTQAGTPIGQAQAATLAGQER